MSESSADFDLLRSALAAFNLSEVETEVYMASLGSGPRPASRIAKATRLSRAYVYDVLSTLVQKGVVREIVRNEVKQFFCASPTELATILSGRQSQLELQQQTLAKALPLIERLSQSVASVASLKQYNYFEGVKRAVEVVLQQQSDPLYVIGDLLTRSTPVAGVAKSVFAAWQTSVVRKRNESAPINVVEFESAAPLEFQAPVASSRPVNGAGKRTNSGLRVRTAGNDLGLPFQVVAGPSCVAIVVLEPSVFALQLDYPPLAAAVTSWLSTYWEQLVPATSEMGTPGVGTGEVSKGPVSTGEVQTQELDEQRFAARR